MKKIKKESKYFQVTDKGIVLNFVKEPEGGYEEVKDMCYNCGCGLPDDAMGQGDAGVDPNGKSITNKTFQEAAESQGMTVEDSKKNTYNLLKKELGEK